MDLLKQLEINYKLISNDLEFASHKLEDYLGAASRADSSIPDLHALQCRLQSLQSIIPGLVKDSSEVVRQRREEESVLNASSLESHRIMVGLYARLGVIPDPDWVTVAQEVESLAPVPRPSAATETELQGFGEAGQERSIEQEGLTGRSADPAHAGKSGASRKEDDRRKHASPGVILEEDFMAVAANTRGRCKLQDVRKVYAKVLEDYQEKASNMNSRSSNKPRPISKKMLDGAGLKVFGLTGDNILNTLRALGLVTVTRNGITLTSPP